MCPPGGSLEWRQSSQSMPGERNDERCRIERCSPRHARLGDVNHSGRTMRLGRTGSGYNHGNRTIRCVGRPLREIAEALPVSEVRYNFEGKSENPDLGVRAARSRLPARATATSSTDHPRCLPSVGRGHCAESIGVRRQGTPLQKPGRRRRLAGDRCDAQGQPSAAGRSSGPWTSTAQGVAHHSCEA